MTKPNPTSDKLYAAITEAHKAMCDAAERMKRFNSTNSVAIFVQSITTLYLATVAYGDHKGDLLREAEAENAALRAKLLKAERNVIEWQNKYHELALRGAAHQPASPVPQPSGALALQQLATQLKINDEQRIKITGLETSLQGTEAMYLESEKEVLKLRTKVRELTTPINKVEAYASIHEESKNDNTATSD